MRDPLILTIGNGAAPTVVSDDTQVEVIVPRVRAAFGLAVVEPVPVEAYIDHGIRGRDLSKVYEASGGPNARIRAMIANSGNTYQDLSFSILKSEEKVGDQPEAYQIVVNLPGKKEDRRNWTNANIEVHVRDDKTSTGKVETIVHIKVDPEAHKGAAGFVPLSDAKQERLAQPYFIAFSLPDTWDAEAIINGAEGGKAGVSADLDTGVLRVTAPVRSNMLGYSAKVDLGRGAPAAQA
jgi:hypothetical protein